MRRSSTLLTCATILASLLILTAVATAQPAENWRRIGLQGVSISALHTLNDSTHLASGPQSVYRSTDRGESWEKFLSVGGFRWFVDGADGFVVAAGSRSLAFSTDHGETWRIPSDQEMSALGAVWSVVVGRDNVIYLGTTQSLYRSDDLGVTWEPRNNGLPSGYPHIGALAVMPDGTIVAGSMGILGGNIYASADGGEEWVPIYERPASETGEPTALAVASDGSLLASISGRGILRTTDLGGSWSPVAVVGEMPSSVRSFLVDEQWVYAVASDGGVIRSNDHGGLWRALPSSGLPTGGVTSITKYPASGSTEPIIAGTGSGVWEMYYLAAVDEVVTDDALRLAPNPAADVVTITARPGSRGFTVVVSDIAGNRRISAASADGSPLRLDVGDLACGVYGIQVLADGVLESRRLVVLRP